MDFPEKYIDRMKELLEDEFPAYLASMEEERARSLRINTGKWIQEEADEILAEILDGRVPWVSEGRYYREDSKPAKLPAYFAGLYYIQEASAMTPGSVIPIRPGDRVMDLCAAPGGKSTQIAARLGGTGVLYSNDISASRAKILLKNLERSGSSNIFVTADEPEKLADAFPGYFQAVLTDVPCSGEGMLRKDAGMIKDWLEKGPSYYAPLQRKILEEAARMTAPGGHILYSTCTFSREEDEDNVEDFLAAHPEFKLEEIPLRPGFSRGFIPGTVRLWPHKVHAEGHFLALLRKEGESGRNQDLCPAWGSAGPGGAALLSAKERRKLAKAGKDKGRGKISGKKGLDKAECVTELPVDFLTLVPEGWTRYDKNNCVYYLPHGETVKAGLRYLRTGLFAGEIKKGRFSPSQAFAMAIRRGDFKNLVSFPMDHPGVRRFLRGETVSTDGAEVTGEEGFTLVTMEGFPLGWAKRRGDLLKNLLNPGWREQ